MIWYLGDHRSSQLTLKILSRWMICWALAIIHIMFYQIQYLKLAASPAKTHGMFVAGPDTISRHPKP